MHQFKTRLEHHSINTPHHQSTITFRIQVRTIGDLILFPRGFCLENNDMKFFVPNQKCLQSISVVIYHQ
ncbi:hypothetical protein CI610_02073 [invertebrate metagenome]|uniref:Uncharacterized protein n=1 Tax=invertebrate metagenome TaxID=1711999 RepID=A0A2H9T6U8_9ZZZZ